MSQTDPDRGPTEDGRALPGEIDVGLFESMVGHGLPIFVRFSSPHCGHSRAMQPAWDRLRRDYPMVVTTIDCTRPGRPCGKYNVRGFPTLRFYGGGDVYAYEGNRDYLSLRAWLASALGAGAAGAR